MNNRYVSILTLWLYAVCYSYAQDLSHRWLTIDDGLSNRVVYDISMDDEGYVWLCTQTNVNYYDGSEIETLSKVIKSESKNQDCQRILQNNNALLIQSFENEDKFVHVDLSTQISTNFNLDSIVGLGKKIFYKKSDAFYFSFSEMDSISLFTFDFQAKSFIKVFAIPKSSASFDNYLFSVLPNEHYYFIFDDYSFLQLDKNGKVLSDTKLDLPDDVSGKPNYIYSDGIGRTWLTFDDQKKMFQLEAKHNILNDFPNIEINPLVVKLSEDSHNNLILLTGTKLKSTGAFLIDTLNNITDKSELITINNHINTIWGPDFHSFFFMTTYEGAYQFYKKPNIASSIFAKKNLPSPLKGHIIRNISKGPDNKIYFTKEALSNPYYFNMNDSSYHISQFKNKLQPGYVCNYDMTIDEAGTIWRLGCNEKTQGRIESYNINNSEYQISTSDYPFSSFCDIGEELYIGSSTSDPNHKILKFNKKNPLITPIPIQGDNPLSRQELKVNYLSHKNNDIWICTNQGLFKYNRVDQIIDPLTEHPALKDINILYLDRDEDELHIGTRNNGLLIYNLQTKASTTFDSNNGLTGQTIASTYKDHKNNIWVATFSGLNVINSETGFVGQFKEEDGISNNEFNRYAIESVDSSRLFLGTLNGLTEINFHNYYQYDFAPLCLQDLVIQEKNGTVVEQRNLRWSKPESIIIREVDLDLEFKLRTKDYRNEIQYQARLIGLNDMWVSLGKNSSYRVGRLEKGDYTLEVRGANQYGQPSGDILRQKVTVDTPFYKGTGFLTAVILLTLGGLTYFFFRLRVKQIHSKAIDRSKINSKFAELELEALRSQMNPHFIFNSLGSIQYFIQTADTKSADDYLTKFALLMRKYLDASKNKYITLEEEFKLLNLYVQLEQLRSDYDFDFDIEIDDEIFPADVKIPSMLMQPYVENAIIHGLSPLKKRKGQLKIKALYKDTDDLTLIIDDNGVGRAQSQLNKMAMGKEHKSRGISMVNDRINTLNKITNAEITIKTIDKKDELNQPTGTMVQIKIKEDE